MDTPTSNPITRRLSSVSHILLVLSGKGGVGKSSSTVQLALTLHSLGYRIGVLDTDLTGPSIPRMFGLDGQGVHQSTDGWVPVYADGETRRLGVMSVGFLLKSSRDSVVWRGPKKEGMIKQFLGDVRWGELDFLLIDTPPGTSDEHLSLMTHLHPLSSRLSSVMITTPQAVSLLDCSKSLSFTRKVSLPVVGLIENMSGYACPCCGDVTYLFGQGGGEEMCKREGLKFLGRVPVESGLVGLLDSTSKMVGEGKKGVVGSAAAAAAAGGAESIENGNGIESEGGRVDAQQEDGEKGEFDVLEQYKKTLSFKLFQGIAAEVVDALKRSSEPTPSEERAAEEVLGGEEGRPEAEILEV